MDRPSPADQRWLFGPWPDLLLGCGLAYAVVFVVQSVAGATLRDALPYATALLPISLVASAHYGATALRVYERAEDRRGYALFTVWSTLLLGGAFAAGVHVAALGSWFVTLYLTWSPWHYAGQNFGVAMTFLRRREVDATPLARRLLHTSFVASSVLAALAMHGIDPGTAYAPGAAHAGDVAFVPLGPLLGVSTGVTDALLLVVAVVYGVATLGALALLLRGGRLRDLVPALLLVGTQALWFSVPVLARHAGALSGIEPLSAQHAAYAFLWVGAGHSVQYLWITSWFARAQGRSRSPAGFAFRSLLAGSALWFVPALLFAPGLLGRVPYDDGLALLVASLVNLHHFVLDGVIWKLREGRVARFLLGPRPAPGAPAAAHLRAPARALLWTGGLAALGVALATGLLPQLSFTPALDRGDVAAAERADRWLDALGQASAERSLQLGQEALSVGDLPRAERHLLAATELRPTAWAYVGLGDVHARREEWAPAAAAYAAALALDPDHPVATFHAGVVDLQLGNPERARTRLLRARELAARPDAPPGLADAVAEVLQSLDPDR